MRAFAVPVPFCASGAVRTARAAKLGLTTEVLLSILAGIAVSAGVGSPVNAFFNRICSDQCRIEHPEPSNDVFECIHLLGLHGIPFVALLWFSPLAASAGNFFLRTDRSRCQLVLRKET